MEKKKLISFIDKYHLAGNANSVKLEIKDKTLHCKFITDDQNVIGSVTMNGFDVEDCTLGIYATSQLTKDFTDKFIKSKNALPETENFAVQSRNGTTEMILNYSTLNTNRITWPLDIPNATDLSATCFSANLFKEILQANKDCEEGELNVSSAGLAKVVFKLAEGTSTYYLVQLQAS